MSDELKPNVGEMYLYDVMTPPLPAGSYRLDASTAVTIGADPQDLSGGSGYFDVVGPRFTLPASEVGGVFPPHNGRGSFSHSIPHIALKRRTLPWERPLNGKAPSNPDPPTGPPPWMALLLLEEGEYQLLESRPLQEVVGNEAFQRLDSPQGVRCNAVELDAGLLDDILPSVEELQLLTHVRQVNTEDRELSAGDSDGWFAVVMSNRMPRPDAECRVCLVSLEGRGDLVKPDPPPVDTGFRLDIIAPFGEPEEGLASSERALLGAPGGEMILRPMGHASFFLRKERLVLLYSWKFFNEGFASFRELMQRLDVAMMGTVRDDAAPKVADTGHLPVKLQNRDGAEEHVLYRGPLVPFPLSRDPLGPYHSADQARRVNAETGAEDVSYAAAFETGRLLAAADGRLGQELLRWRQDAYRHSVRADEAALIVRNLSLPQALDLHAPLVPVVATRTMDRVLEGSGPLADPYGLRPIDKVPGLNPAELRQAWNLSSDDAAAAILGKPGDSVTPAVEAPAVTGRAPTTIDQVASTAPLLDHLDRARDRVLTNVRVRLEEKP